MTEPEKFLLADFLNEDFTPITDFPHVTQCSIMPVVAMRGNKFIPMGTCFSISNQGLVLTARHVIDEILAMNDGEKSPADHWWVGALYAAKPEINQETTTGLTGGILIANKVHFSSSLDIAAIHLNLPVNEDTNKPLRMPAHRLSPAIPDIGSKCLAIGYHSMKCTIPNDGVHTHQVIQSYSASRGQIEEIHFPHRDLSNLTFPCFQVSMRLDAGMSGGPVINENGNVIGVVCSSLGSPEMGGFISYASLIGPSLLLQITGQGSDGIIGQKFLYDFIVGGSVLLDNTADKIKVERAANALSIDFGRPPPMKNHLLT